MIFVDRSHAGKLLGERLQETPLRNPLLLALPRGGVPVAVEVAKILGAQMDVLVVRKLGVPWHRELGMGAVAEGGHIWIDRKVVEAAEVSEESLAQVIKRERLEVERRVRLYRPDRPFPPLADRSVVLIDDGVAMGVSAKAACTFARHMGASQVVLAVPVCSPKAAISLRDLVDDLICLDEPDSFRSVGNFYEDFQQLSDREVLSLLNGFYKKTKEKPHDANHEYGA